MSEYELLKAQLRPLSWSDIDARFGVPMDQTMRKAAAAIEALEAKLAKAVEAFEKLARLGNGDRYGNSDGNMIARAALEEIEGEKG